MATTRLVDESAAFRLLHGVIVQARKDLTRPCTRPMAKESALEFWGTVAEVTRGVNRPEPDYRTGLDVGALLGADVRTKRTLVHRNASADRAAGTNGAYSGGRRQ